jgi:phage tail-like protein
MAEQRRAILRIAGPEVAQERLEVSAALKIGRLATSDLPLQHNKISREHARFVLTEAGLTVEDLGSSNGTFVGSQKVEPNQPVPLKIGDVVRMGPFVFTFEQLIEAGAAGDKPLSATVEMQPLPTPALTPTQAIPPEQVAEAAEPPAWTEPIEAEAPAVKTPAPPKAETPTKAKPRAPKAPPPEMLEPPPPRPPTAVSTNGRGPLEPLKGIPPDVSSWLQYLPALYSDDPFVGRFLLIFEALFAPDEWIVDNFDLYLDPRLAPPEFLEWFGQWVDILTPGTIPETRQRAIAGELGMLFLARGTRTALSRHLELAFGAPPQIEEPPDKPYTFVVRLKLGQQHATPANRDLATRIIEAQRPAHTYYTLTIE